MISPAEHKEKLIVAQNQSSVAVELTKLSFKGKVPTKKQIMKRYFEVHNELMQNFQEKYINTK